MSRPFVRSGQWSQTTAGMFQPAARLGAVRAALGYGTECRDTLDFVLNTEPVDMKFKSIQSLLANACLFLAVLFLGAADCLGQQAERSATIQANRSGQLPRVLSVESMLKPDASVERYLSRTPKESAYEKASFITDNRTRTSDGEVQWTDSIAGWTSPEFYTRPLYFEQANFERFESSSPEWTRPVVSYAQFLASIPVLPYKTGANGPRDRIYSVGHYPYGTRAPSRSLQLSKRGMVFQGVATTGLVFFIP